MKAKMKFKIGIDVLMTAGLLFLMPYELVGRSSHEWIGTGVCLLFILHHVLNRKWTAHILKGRYTKFRIFQTVLAVIIFITMIGSMISGIFLSEYVFADIRIKGIANASRMVHMLCAYWGFVLMSLHLGLHWNLFLRLFDRKINISAQKKTYGFRILAGVIALYGCYAFVKRQIGSYMFLRMHFVFFDYMEPLIFFMADYIAVMGLFIAVGYYLGMFLKKER